jgi:hypothetical protein
MILEFRVQFPADGSLSPHFPIDWPPTTLQLYGAYSLTQKLWVQGRAPDLICAGSTNVL